MGHLQVAVSMLTKDFELHGTLNCFVIATGLSDQFSRTYGLAIGTVILMIGNIVSATSYHIWYVYLKEKLYFEVPFVLNGGRCQVIQRIV